MPEITTYERRQHNNPQYEFAKKRYRQAMVDYFFMSIFLMMVFGLIVSWKTTWEGGHLLRSRFRYEMNGIRWCENTVYFPNRNVTCSFSERCDVHSPREVYVLNDMCFEPDDPPCWYVFYGGILFYLLALIPYAYDVSEAEKINVRHFHYDHSSW